MSASITPSDILEYLYCPRFIYFMHCLNIKQHEENRYKVLKGREVHKMKASTNKNYMRKKLNVINREFEVPLKSEKYRFHGILDEIFFLEDGSLAPFDYKFAEYKDKLFTTYKIQAVMYAILLKENYNKPVNTGYLCFVRSKNLIKEIEFKEKDFEEAINIVNETFKIIQTGKFPKKTKYTSRCIDCCYKNICVK
jgi:CRISPR-associated exonuclease Cas4